MTHADFPCARLALCRSESSRTEGAGFGWVFPEPSLECVEEALANARGFCDEMGERELIAHGSIRAYWSGADGESSAVARLSQDGLERLLREREGQAPDLILIHIATRAPSRATPEAVERSRREQRNDLIIGLAAIHAWGFEFEEIAYSTSPSAAPEESAKIASCVAFERMELDQAALEPKAASGRPGL